MRSLTERCHTLREAQVGGNSLREAGCQRKEGRRFSLIREERGAGLSETIIRETGGRQMILREEGGRSDLCDIPLLTICKLHKHLIFECIINEKAWLTVLTNA